MKKTLAVLVVLAMLLSFGACANSGNPQTSTTESTAATVPSSKVIRLSTTTSVNDSGLLPYLLPYFESETGYTVEVTSNGTGAAIALGQSGDADLLLVHSKAKEEEFVSAGYGVKRIPFMYNFFVIAGPQSDPAKISSCANATEAFKLIAAAAKTPFISRGDDSGTHNAEKKIWETAKLTPKAETDKWYVSVGSGMGDTLNKANELSAYVLTDKGTFLANQKNLPNLKILLEKGDDMKNTYSLIAVSSEKFGDINSQGAEALIQWMTKDSTLKLISEYGNDKYGQPLFYIPQK